ncbi:chemotaxis protein histidine kinase CheA [Desulfobaculum xiamenense]|uniref:Chemotaxis protein histidine kinase CheA n=1 Tax=Desulfobaculum xiamenense TaxID=995050 RepID=A0A846QK19_9BACT|nr:Hpt domain-containing protein [Desulfobaculum xiamenense]NJB66523.1 chemotaxis protein histidine kinase CheA [Desulfobaculum xiamenense]
MSESDEMVTEFYSQVNDDFYPLIMEGTDLLGQGRVQDGIEVLARPLHTIKGVTGFMSGFEIASTFTHKVESFLKKLQAGELEHSEENITAAMHAVTHVFQLLDQIREMGEPDKGEMDSVLDRLEKASGGGEGAATAAVGSVDIESSDGCMVARVSMPRVHLDAHREILRAALGAVDSGMRVVVDLSEVLTMNRAGFETLEEFAGRLDLRVSGMGPGCKGTFYGWGFDSSIRVQGVAPDTGPTPDDNGGLN